MRGIELFARSNVGFMLRVERVGGHISHRNIFCRSGQTRFT